MVFEEVANTILDFADYGLVVLILLLVWEIIQFIKGGTDAKTKSVSELNLTDWSKSPILKMSGFNRWRRRANTAQLNTYLEEQKETELLNEAVKQAQEALAKANQIVNSASIDSTSRNDLMRETRQLKVKLGDARKEYKGVNRNTWRMYRRTNTVLEKMKKKDEDTTQLIALENNILKLHKENVTELDKVLAEFANMGKALDEVDKVKLPSPLALKKKTGLMIHLEKKNKLK